MPWKNAHGPLWSQNGGGERLIAGSFQTSGSAGVTAVSGAGIQSVTRTGIGQYQVVLAGAAQYAAPAATSLILSASALGTISGAFDVAFSNDKLTTVPTGSIQLNVINTAQGTTVDLPYAFDGGNKVNMVFFVRTSRARGGT